MSAPIAMSDEQTGDSSWVHFAPYGTWKGHEDGAFKLDREVFESVIERFNQTQNDLQVDYNHDSVKPNTTGPKPAAGWIKALEIRGTGKDSKDGLWGLVEWTNRAAAFIRNREYKYTSPVIDFKGKDRKSGKVVGPELFNAALTNDPFLDGQVPLALERLPLQMEIKIKDQKQEGQAVAASQDTGDVSAMQDEGMGGGFVDKIAEAVGMEPSAVEAIMLEKLDEIVAIVASSQNQDGTPADEAAASQVPAGQSVAADKWSQAKNGRDQLELSRLSSRVKELEDRDRKELQARVGAHVAKKIDDGEIPIQSQKLAEELYLEDWDRAESIYCSKIVPIGVSQSTKTPAKGKNSNLSDIEKEAVDGLIRCGYKRDKATERVVAQRKVN